MTLELHATRLETLWMCGERYNRRYVPPEEKIPPGFALLVGAGTHISAHVNLQSVIDNKKMIPLEEAKALARDHISGAFKAGDFSLSAEERALKSPAGWRDQAVNQVVALAACHYEKIAPILKPTKVERPWLIHGPGFDLAGTLDVQEGSYSVRDLKTKASTPPRDAVARSDQLTMYALAVQVLDGAAPEHVFLDAIVKLVRGPKVVIQTSARDDTDFAVLLRRVEIAKETIEAGIFTPANRDSWWCSEKFCGYFDTCPYVRGRSVHRVELPDGEGITKGEKNG